MLEIRVADGSLLRLIGKGLHVGVLVGVELSTPESGTAQGSVLSSWLQATVNGDRSIYAHLRTAGQDCPSHTSHGMK